MYADDLENIVEDIYKRRKSLVGWGTGSVFSYFDSSFPLNLDFLVDNDESKWGMMVGGHRVYSPFNISNEDPDKVVVIIYSSFASDIKAQLASMGPYTAISASMLFGYREWRHFQNELSSLPDAIPGREKIQPEYAILMQGPVVDDFTEKALKYYSCALPDALLILSTWEGTDSNIVQGLQKYADLCLLNTKPHNSGPHNRNLQICSTLNGLKAAKNFGVRKVLKSRTDNLLFSKGILNQCDRLHRQYNTPDTHRFGLKYRLVIPETFTRKYILYHPSDMVMYGDIDDLIAYWEIPYDDRQELTQDDSCSSLSLKEISMRMVAAESYFGRHFCSISGWTVKNTLQDSWNYYRDLFIVMDNQWFNLFWHKNPAIPDLKTTNTYRDMITHYFWQQLYFNDSNLISEQQVNLDSATWQDFGNFRYHKPGW